MSICGRPSSSKTYVSYDEVSREEFNQVYKAIGGLTQLMENLNKSFTASEGPIADCTIEQWKRMRPPIFKWTADPVEAKA